jgi:hypothetical protein
VGEVRKSPGIPSKTPSGAKWLHQTGINPFVLLHSRTMTTEPPKKVTREGVLSSITPMRRDYSDVRQGELVVLGLLKPTCLRIKSWRHPQEFRVKCLKNQATSSTAARFSIYPLPRLPSISVEHRCHFQTRCSRFHATRYLAVSARPRLVTINPPTTSGQTYGSESTAVQNALPINSAIDSDLCPSDIRTR